MIDEFSKIDIEVFIPVDLPAGCQVEIIIPKIVDVTSELKTVSVKGILGGSNEEQAFTLIDDSHSIFLRDVCSEYTRYGKATIHIESLGLPHYVTTTDSFQVKFYGSYGEIIAHTTGGMTVSTKEGTLEIKDWFPDNYIVDELSSIIFSVQPLHRTTSNDV